MPKIKFAVAVLTVLALSACSTGQMPSRSLIGDADALAGPIDAGATQAVESGKMVLVQTAYDVTKINVDVPRTLRVSEANVFFPIADIVWHGDPSGDRYAQVASILQEGLAAGTAGMKKGRAVVIDVTLTRFHALTPKTRYTFGGMHTTHFNLTVLDAKTGEVIDGPRAIAADVHGSGGQRAVAEEAAGITQRVVIEGRIAEVIKLELSQHLVPAGQAPAPDMTVSRNAFSPEALTVDDWNGPLHPAK